MNETRFLFLMYISKKSCYLNQEHLLERYYHFFTSDYLRAVKYPVKQNQVVVTNVQVVNMRNEYSTVMIHFGLTVYGG